MCSTSPKRSWSCITFLHAISMQEKQRQLWYQECSPTIQNALGTEEPASTSLLRAIAENRSYLAWRTTHSHVEAKDVTAIIAHRHLEIVHKTHTLMKQKGTTSYFYREQRRDSVQGSKCAPPFPTRNKSVHTASRMWFLAGWWQLHFLHLYLALIMICHHHEPNSQYCFSSRKPLTRLKDFHFLSSVINW